MADGHPDAIEPGFRLRLSAELDRLSYAIEYALAKWIKTDRTVPVSIATSFGPREILSAPPLDPDLFLDYVGDSFQSLQEVLLHEGVVFEVESQHAPFAGLKESIYAVRTVQGWRNLRLDQMISARWWGIRFEGAGPIVDRLERATFEALVRRFLASMRGASRILSWKALEPPLNLPPFVPDDLERLILDVLNEHSEIARLAPVEEDFLEKTDLRVRYPDLARKRGARIQVSWSTSSETFLAKRESIRLPGELVIVSPYSIAQADPNRNAYEWRYLFEDAIRDGASFAAGPIDGLPRRAKRHLQEFVRIESVRSTEELRERERQTRRAESELE